MLGKPGLLAVLAAALVALALVPGSMSATDGAGESQPGVDALSIALDHVTTNAADLGGTRTDVANLDNRVPASAEIQREGANGIGMTPDFPTRVPRQQQRGGAVYPSRERYPDRLVDGHV